MRGSLGFVLVLLAVVLLLHGCVDDVFAKKGTHRVSRMISDTRPWFDCLSEDYAVGSNVVTCNDDTNDDAPPIQACIDAASAVNGVAYLGQCEIDIDTSLELNDPVTLMGCGGNSAWAQLEADGRKGCTTITMDDDMGDDTVYNAACVGSDDPTAWCTGDGTGTRPFSAIYVRGDGVNSRGHTDGDGDIGAQGINIIGIKILSETFYEGGIGITLDGTFADELACDEPGGCPAGCTLGVDCTCEVGAGYTSTDPHCRGLVRHIRIQDTGCFKTGSHCFYQTGNVFDITYQDVFSQRTTNTGLITVDLADATCGNSTCRTGQNVVHDGLFFSCPRSADTCENTAWAVDTHYTYYEGGHIQGDFGAKLGQNSTLIGTHVEEDSGGASSTGIQITDRNTVIITEAITAWENCLIIGVDGSADIVSSFFIDVGNISNCGTMGVTIEQGGQRRGVMNVGHWTGNGQDIDNQQSGTTWNGDVVHSIIGESFKHGAALTTDSIIDLREDEIQIGDRTAADQIISFMITTNPVTVPILMWDNSETRFLFDNTQELAIGDGSANDQALTFVDDAGDHTFHYDSADEIYEMDGKLKVGGTGSSITASAASDMEILVDNGQHFEPDTMKWKACADYGALTTSVIDDCNIVMFSDAANDVVTINTCDAANEGRILYIVCKDSTATKFMDDDGNMRLAGADTDITCSDDDTLTLMCWDPGGGYEWQQIAQSAN